MSRRKPLPRTARQTTRRLDNTLTGIVIPKCPSKGWVRAIREAIGMTQAQLGRRLGITRQAIASIEASELDGSASLSRLRRTADALGCDLRYVLVPRKPLEQIVSDQARLRAENKLRRVNRSQALEASALGADSMSTTVADLARELELNRPSDLWDE